MKFNLRIKKFPAGNFRTKLNAVIDIRLESFVHAVNLFITFFSRKMKNFIYGFYFITYDNRAYF